MNRTALKRVLGLLAAAGTALLLAGTAGGGMYDTERAGPTADRNCAIKLDVNRATLSELEQIPGVQGPAAYGIIDYRETHGPFGNVAELMKARDVDALTFSILRDKVVVVPAGDMNQQLATADGSYVWSCTGG